MPRFSASSLAPIRSGCKGRISIIRRRSCWRLRFIRIPRHPAMPQAIPLPRRSNVRRRPATLADVDAIVAMGERFRATTAYATRLAPNADQMRALTERVVTNPDGVIMLAEDERAPVGMLAAIVYTHHISGQRVAGEI